MVGVNKTLVGTTHSETRDSSQWCIYMYCRIAAWDCSGRQTEKARFANCVFVLWTTADSGCSRAKLTLMLVRHVEFDKVDMSDGACKEFGA